MSIEKLQTMHSNDGIHRIDVNLKYETYCNAISDGGEEEWDFGWERYENSQE